MSDMTEVTEHACMYMKVSNFNVVFRQKEGFRDDSGGSKAILFFIGRHCTCLGNAKKIRAKDFLIV